MKTSQDYLGKPTFLILFLKESLEIEKDGLSWIEQFIPITEGEARIKQDLIDLIKSNITKLTKEINDL